MIAKPTFDINVAAIDRRRRGQYDLEDEFVWFHQLIVDNPHLGWIKQKSGPVTLSDNEARSLIKLDCPGIELLNQKQNFVRLFDLEPWVPKGIVIAINKETGNLTEESLIRLERFSPDKKLLFLKKAGVGIGGGFDVDAILNSLTLKEDILKAITRQNEAKRFERFVFVLQEGIQNPLLTPKGQKTDLRLYMLIVGDDMGNNAFYACKVGDVRNTAEFPYDPLNVDPNLQITNIAQNIPKVQNVTAEITRLFPGKSTPLEVYETIFKYFVEIIKRIAVIFSPFLISSNRSPFVTLIGLDAVVDRDTHFPWIVEMNKRPTVYTPKRALEMNYSSSVFMDDVFNLGIMSVVDGAIGRQPLDDELFVLVSR